jgi:putative FmdB family regulatory protein
MPIYEYVCERCETKFEALRPVTRMDEPALCPGGHAGARRVLSRFAAVSRDEYGDAGEFENAAGGGCGGCAGGCTCGAN